MNIKIEPVIVKEEILHYLVFCDDVEVGMITKVLNMNYEYVIKDYSIILPTTTYDIIFDKVKKLNGEVLEILNGDSNEDNIYS